MVKNNYLAGQPILCQLLSLVPKHLVDESVAAHQSDRYYKTMTTYKQFVFLFYGVIMRCKSLNNLCKNLLLLEGKLIYLGIKALPAVSTLSDANIKRGSEVFATLYQKLYQHYQDTLKPCLCHFKENLEREKIFCFDSSTITLFVDIFKGAGCNTLNGKKKGGLKLHTKLPLMGFVPDLVTLSEASCNDKSFLGRLEVAKGAIYIFDKGYAHYQVWIALIAQLIFSVIHRQIKEAEAFVTLVNVASNNMGSYVGLIKIMKSGRLKEEERNLEIVQLQIFELEQAGTWQTSAKNSLDSS